MSTVAVAVVTIGGLQAKLQTLTDASATIISVTNLGHNKVAVASK